MTAKDLVIAAIRTVAQVVGAYIITFLIEQGWDFPDDVDAQINAAVFLGVLAAWNLLINFLATRVHPAFGYLSLIPKTPAYADARGILTPEDAPAVVTTERGTRVDGLYGDEVPEERPESPGSV